MILNYMTVLLLIIVTKSTNNRNHFIHPDYTSQRLSERLVFKAKCIGYVLQNKHQYWDTGTSG